jgi:hypothetical protein
MSVDKADAIKVFTKKLTIKFLLLAAIAGIVFYFFLPQYYFQFLPVVFIYFYATNYIVYRILIKSHDYPTAKFSRYCMLITFIKFFGALIFAVLYMIFAKESLIPFLVIFIILYFSSLIQLVREFLGFVTKKSKR